jgi:hypothetical protein
MDSFAKKIAAYYQPKDDVQDIREKGKDSRAARATDLHKVEKPDGVRDDAEGEKNAQKSIQFQCPFLRLVSQI